MRSECGKGGGGHQSGNRLPHAALAPPSSHLKPALGHSVHVPPHGAGGCGRGRVLRRAECKDEAPRAGQGVPGPGEGRGTAGRARRRGGETSRLRLGLLHLPWRRRRRRLLVASSSLSSASTSTQNKNTPHLPATSLLIGQSSPGLGTAWGGGRRSARQRRRGTTPPPLSGAAGDGRPGSSQRAAATRARSRLPGRQAHREQERQGSAYLSVYICVWEGLWGGCECARARGPRRERKAGQLHAVPEPRFSVRGHEARTTPLST